MRLMVTGGAGFIGSAFIRQLATRNVDRIINIDSLTYASTLDSVLEVSSLANYFFIQADITDKLAIADAIKEHQPDIIVNFAAESHVDRSIASSNIFIDTNITGVANLLDCTKDFAPHAKFIQISTDEVYGDSYSLDRPATEDSYIHASSPYSASKAAAEQLVLAWARTYDIDVTITRCTNNYGPWQNAEKLIPKVIFCALAGDAINVYGSGEQQRDWLYVTDHVNALLAIIDNFSSGQIYNIAGNNLLSNNHVIHSVLTTVATITGRSQSDLLDLIEYIDDRPGHDQRYVVSSEKIRRSIKWQPLTEFNLGISKTVEWYLNRGH